jgi:hypothetical protein
VAAIKMNRCTSWALTAASCVGLVSAGAFNGPMGGIGRRFQQVGFLANPYSSVGKLMAAAEGFGM